jgi:hypothetical protein
MTPSVVPAVLDGWMRPFQGHFTAAVWRHGLVLVCGALLAPGRRTVAAALRVMGLGETAGFAAYHRVLRQGHWCSRALAHRLLLLLVAAFVPDGPVVVGLDDSIERRRGKRIRAKGIYRDPVRSSRGHFVEASGLRWLCVMLLAPVSWAGCVWGLPFPTVLAPSERSAAERGKRHKKLTDWGRQALLQVARWLPGRRIVAVADSSFSAIALLRDLAPHLAVVTRLRLDARPPVKGRRLPSLAERLRDRRTPWRRVAIEGWYGRSTRRLDIASGTALWHHPGMRVAIRWGPAQCAERCAIRAARRSRKPSSAPTRRPSRSTSCAGSCAAGGPKQRSKRLVGTSAWRPSGSGPTSPSCAPRRRCSPCSPS